MTVVDGDDTAPSSDAASVSLGLRLVLEAFRFKAVAPSDTAYLGELRHDKHLLPRITEQLNALLSYIPPDLGISYDVQGLADQGTDILVRLAADNATKYICLQVKSHSEVAKEDLTGKLRAQHSESMDHYGEQSIWCPVLAVDISSHDVRIQSRLRKIRKAFAKKPRTFVLDPGAVAGFMQLTPVQMAGLVTLTMRSDRDPVLAAARADLIRHPLHSAVLIRVLAEAVVPGACGVTSQDLYHCDWLGWVSWRVPWVAALDGPFHGGSALPWDVEFASAQKQFDWSGDPTVETVLDLHFPSPESLAWLLQPRGAQSISEAESDRLRGRLPNAIDALVETGELDCNPTGRLDLRVSDHPGLYALACEAQVKYEMSVESLMDYVVQILLPEVGDPPLSTYEP